MIKKENYNKYAIYFENKNKTGITLYLFQTCIYILYNIVYNI